MTSRVIERYSPPTSAIPNANSTAPMASPVAGLVQPRSAIAPAIGATITPPVPASANNPMLCWVSPKRGLASSSGTAVQNKLKLA